MIAFTIKGEPASKSNSRKLATIGGRNVVIDGEKTRVGGFTKFIKSDKARDYERDALLQIPAEAKQMLTGEVRVTLRIFYATQRPDLDESIVLDVLQAKYAKAEESRPRELVRRGVYINDRQVREKHVYHGIDKANPRTEIEIEPMEPQQVAMFHVEPAKPAKKRVSRTASHSAPSLADLQPDEKPF